MKRIGHEGLERLARALGWWLGGAMVLAGSWARAEDPFARLSPRQVQVGGEIGRRIDVTVRNNLLQLNVDQDFLKPFQQRKAGGGFVGLGMFIDAVVRFAAHTSDPKVLALKKHVIAQTIQTQEPDGYIGMMAAKSRMWKLWDIHEMGYLIYGLTSDWQFFQEQQSLEAARKLADYLVSRWTAEPRGDPSEGGITVHMAVTGLERTLLTLSAATGDRRYEEFCLGPRELRQWDLAIVRGRWGRIEGHAYAYFAHCLAQLQLHRAQPDERLLRTTRRAMDFLTKGDGLVISGTCGDHECWHDTQSGTTNLGETCATAYLIRTLDDLLRLDGDARWGDIMERAIFNALFAAQSPDGRRIRYYVPFECSRVYFPGDTYCCPNNYRRVVAELPGMIYYRAKDGLAVNLYTASRAQLELESGVALTVRQETDYPNSGRVVLAIEPAKPAEFTLRLRVPRWSGEAKVAINGDRVREPALGGKFLAIRRTWQPGDRVELNLPLVWRLVKGRQNQAGRVAVMRGPLLFALSRQRNQELGAMDPRLLTAAPSTLEGPLEDDSVRPGGMACRLEAWKPGAWYPSAKTDLRLRLTEFADPGAEATYFHVPNPDDPAFVHDELVELGRGP